MYGAVLHHSIMRAAGSQLVKYCSLQILCLLPHTQTAVERGGGEKRWYVYSIVWFHVQTYILYMYQQTAMQTALMITITNIISYIPDSCSHQYQRSKTKFFSFSPSLILSLSPSLPPSCLYHSEQNINSAIKLVKSRATAIIMWHFDHSVGHE